MNLLSEVSGFLTSLERRFFSSNQLNRSDLHHLIRFPRLNASESVGMVYKMAEEVMGILRSVKSYFRLQGSEMEGFTLTLKRWFTGLACPLLTLSVYA